MTQFPGDPPTIHVTLPEELLPAGYTLVLHARAGLLACLAPDREGGCAQLVEAAWLTGEEARVLGSLLMRAPRHCPYEDALAALAYPSASEEAVARCRQRLRLAQQGGYLEQEMALVRSILHTLNGKLQVIGLTIVALLETGYALQPYRKACGGHPREERQQE
jgi:hypothetical protein